MPIYQGILNPPDGTPESVDVTPFASRGSWIESTSDSRPGMVVYRAESDHWLADFTKRVMRSNREIRYPTVIDGIPLSDGASPTVMKPFRATRVRQEIATGVNLYDSATSVTLGYTPLVCGMDISYVGPTFPSTNALLMQFFLGCVAEWWPSVTTGVPSAATLDALGLGQLHV